MDTNFYLDKFNEATQLLNKSKFQKVHIEAAVVEVLNSVCLKLYKPSWATPAQDPLTANSRIFFSIWVSDQGINQQRLYYNIHALKLRKLDGCQIESRKFAELFRNAFKEFEAQWPNVSVAFGPQTLMEGWVALNSESLVDDIVALANQFLVVAHLIDISLAKFKKD